MRLRLVFASILLVWTILLAKIYQYSVKSNSYFENIALENAVKTTQIIPVRGQILDRLSNPLAINRLGFSLSIAPHLKDNELNATIAEISRYFVPVKLVGTPIGLKNKGVLVYFKRRLVVKCKGKDLPNAFVINVDKLDVNDSILVRDIEIPQNVRVLDGATVAVAGVIAAK